MSKKITLAIVALLGLIALATAAEPTTPSGKNVDQALLNDLARIREKMGGSVLSGSVLDAGDEDRDAEFQEGVQTLLEKSEADRKPRLPEFEETHARSNAPGDSVKMLRDQGVTLERIANDLERLKQYGHADELRESARALRLIARQLDTPERAAAVERSGETRSSSKLEQTSSVDEQATPARFATLQNGRLTLHGTFDSLAGIEVHSKGGHLSTETSPEFRGMPLKTPFIFAEGMMIQNTPNAVVIGVLGVDRRISVSGATDTSVFYSESEQVAVHGDLTVSVGDGGNPPMQIPVRSIKAPE